MASGIAMSSSLQWGLVTMAPMLEPCSRAYASACSYVVLRRASKWNCAGDAGLKSFDMTFALWYLDSTDSMDRVPAQGSKTVPTASADRSTMSASRWISVGIVKSKVEPDMPWAATLRSSISASDSSPEHRGG